MKKDASNTFDGGLNYDLNPITTPNNVLTDCVNGTFLTFNGDELALQNDAGNTKIKFLCEYDEWDPDKYYEKGTTVTYNDEYFEAVSSNSKKSILDNSFWKNVTEYVELSEGFYPLAVKEYGGVLYIVSGKNALYGTESFDPTKKYTLYDIVVNNGLYYQSNTINNTSEITNIDKWRPLGTLVDALEIYDTLENASNKSYIEFGSYPSQEVYVETGYNSGFYNIINTETNLDNVNLRLYQPKVLNKITFKSGMLIYFDKNEISKLNTSNLSYYEYDGTKIPKFYNLKLYHQLTNGLLDLTEDIWTRYYNHIGNNNTSSNKKHWFYNSYGEPIFTYYCNSRFKGKLLVNLEIEDVITYDIIQYPFPDLKNGKYTITIKIKSTFNEGSVEISNLSLQYCTSNDTSGRPDYNSNTESATFDSNSIAKFTLEDIDPAIIFYYKISPKFKYDGVEYDSLVEGLLPKEYTDKYVIENSMLFSQDVKGAKLITWPDSTICEIIDNIGYKYYSKLLLVDNIGRYINDDLEYYTANDYPYYFEYVENIEDFEDPGSSSVILGAYTINRATNKIDEVVYTWGKNSANLHEIITNFHEEIRILSPECAVSKVTVNFNLPINTLIINDSDHNSYQYIDNSNLNLHTYSIDIICKVGISLEIISQSYDEKTWNIFWKSPELTESEHTYNLAYVMATNQFDSVYIENPDPQQCIIGHLEYNTYLSSGGWVLKVIEDDIQNTVGTSHDDQLQSEIEYPIPGGEYASIKVSNILWDYCNYGYKFLHYKLYNPGATLVGNFYDNIDEQDTNYYKIGLQVYKEEWETISGKNYKLIIE